MELSHIPTPADTMPVSTTAVMPSMAATVAAARARDHARAWAYGLGDVATQPGLTPSSLLNPMPSITNSTPQVVGPACTGVNQWINDNPLFAVGILAGLAFLMLGGGKGEHHK